ncbi:MAG: FAD-binding oxidoreductase [Verrucomicrobia bacterium]|nr:FAD-binding oxidoreductase [Verrucomicrobiota bacterium]
MVLQPASVEELCRTLGEANARAEKITALDLRALDRVVEYTPEDMTVTVQAGLTLAQLQARLAERGQWLPIDPPQPDRLSIGALLATNASGPRRYGHGTIREHLLGIRVALADGRLIKAGGKVVKNVAGYDLCKLFVGSYGSLGVIAEATFKVQPLPEAEQPVQARCDSLDEAGKLIEAIVESPLTPIALDLHNVPPATPATSNQQPSPLLCVILAFAGTREEVDWQLAEARRLGAFEAAELDYETRFRTAASADAPHTLSVLPSKLTGALRDLGTVTFVARAGNGVVYYRGGPAPPKLAFPRQLTQRVKDAYDPKHILPELPL